MYMSNLGRRACRMLQCEPSATHLSLKSGGWEAFACVRAIGPAGTTSEALVEKGWSVEAATVNRVHFFISR